MARTEEERVEFWRQRLSQPRTTNTRSTTPIIPKKKSSFSFLGDVFGSGRQEKPEGFVGQVFQSTIGSGGLAGLARSATDAVSDTIVGKAASMTGDSTAQLSSVTDALVEKLGDLTPDDPRRKALESQIRENITVMMRTGQANDEIRAKATTDSGTDSSLNRIGTVAGQALNTAATFAPVAKAPFVAAAGQTLSTGQKAANLGLRTAEFSGLGAAGSVGQDLASGERDPNTIIKNAAKTAAITSVLPIGAVAAKGVAKGAGRVVTDVLGVTTGAGGATVREAFTNRSPEFLDALRGKTNKMDIVTMARDALQGLRDTRSMQYRKRFAEIAKNKAEIQIDPVKAALEKGLSDFKISRQPSRALGIAGDGTNLDFSRSKLIGEPTEKARLGEIVNLIDDWGNQPGDLTPEGLDNLKQILDNFYSPNSAVRSVVAGLRNDVKQLLVKEVPGYEAMTKDYATTSGLIDDIEKNLGLRDKASIETTITKLSDVLKEDKEFRRALASQLENASGRDIAGAIAGANMNTLVPRGLAGRLLAGGTLGGSFLTGPGILGLLAAAATFSPRIVAEFGRALGVPARVLNEMLAVPGVRRAVKAGITQGTANEVRQP